MQDDAIAAQADHKVDEHLQPAHARHCYQRTCTVRKGLLCFKQVAWVLASSRVEGCRGSPSQESSEWKGEGPSAWTPVDSICSPVSFSAAGGCML